MGLWPSTRAMQSNFKPWLMNHEGFQIRREAQMVINPQKTRNKLWLWQVMHFILNMQLVSVKRADWLYVTSTGLWRTVHGMDSAWALWKWTKNITLLTRWRILTITSGYLKPVIQQCWKSPSSDFIRSNTSGKNSFYDVPSSTIKESLVCWMKICITHYNKVFL